MDFIEVEYKNKYDEHFIYRPCYLPGMRNNNYSWASDVLTGNLPTSHHQYFRVIVCILEFWQQQLMLPPTLVPSLYFIIQGILCSRLIIDKLHESLAQILFYCTNFGLPVYFTLLCPSELVLQSLLFHSLSARKQYTIFECLWACVSE